MAVHPHSTPPLTRVCYFVGEKLLSRALNIPLDLEKSLALFIYFKNIYLFNLFLAVSGLSCGTRAL